MSEQRGRYERSASGMVGAMLVLLLVIGAFVGFRALNRDELEVRPDPVDYLVAVRAAQSGDWQVAYPESLPRDWTATSLEAEPEQSWGIGFLTPGGFAGVQQSSRPEGELLETYVDEETSALPAVEPGGGLAQEWRAFADADGDRAYAAQVGDDTVLVYGSAPEEDLLRLVRSLTTDPLPAEQS